MGTDSENNAGPRTFGSDFRRFFLRGLSGIVPPLLTIAILFWAYGFIDRNIGQYVTEGMLRLMVSGGSKPDIVSDADILKYGEPIDQFDDQGRRLTREFVLVKSNRTPDKFRARILWEIAFRKYRLDLVGFILAIIIIYFVGFFLASFIGRATWQGVERAFFRIPIVKAVYPHVKQVTNVVLSERKLDVSGVVAVEFPSPGQWSVGLVVGEGFDELKNKLGDDILRVFVMYSPTPFTGFAIMIRRADAIPLRMTLDEAVRFCVSCGVVAPGEERLPPLEPQSPWRSQPHALKPAGDYNEKSRPGGMI